MSVEYDGLAEAYGRYRKCHPSVLRDIVTSGALTKESRVLEIGAGTGNYVAALSELVGCACSAVEPSDGMRAIAATNAKGVEVKAGRAEELPFEAESFDLAFCVNVVHHVTDRRAFFREAFRVLRSDGSLCIATESHDMIRKRFVLSEYFPETADVDIVRYSTVADLRTMADAAGFTEWHAALANADVTVESADVYEAKAFSCLHLIPQAAFEVGLRRLKEALRRGPLRATVAAFVMLWATK